MEKSAYLDAMKIVRWRSRETASPLEQTMWPGLLALAEHPLLAQLSLQLDDDSLVITQDGGRALTISVGAISLPENKKRLWTALCDAGLF